MRALEMGDLPPRIAQMIATTQRQVKLAFGLIGTLASGLVGVAVYCIAHHG
jgi:hypothetical protein